MWAIKVPFPLDAAIVFAGLLIKLDAHPLADLEACWADKADGAFATIVELDRLSGLEFLHYEQRSSSRGIVPTSQSLAVVVVVVAFVVVDG